MNQLGTMSRKGILFFILSVISFGIIFKNLHSRVSITTAIDKSTLGWCKTQYFMHHESFMIRKTCKLWRFALFQSTAMKSYTQETDEKRIFYTSGKWRTDFESFQHLEPCSKDPRACSNT